jgi:hypothetical protein
MAVLKTHSNIDVVHADRSNQHVDTENGSDNQRDWQHEWRQKIEQRLVHFLEDEDFCTNFPESELPGTKDVSHVVEHAVHEEEVPAIEALTEDCHLAEAAATATGEENRGRCFGLDEDRATHGYAASKFAGGVAEEPVLGDGEAASAVSGWI